MLLRKQINEIQLFILRNEIEMEVIRDYDSYSEYLHHQSEKTLDAERRKLWLNEEWKPKHLAFKDCFERVFGRDLSGKNCLGICARTGQEIQAFIDLGAEAIGIDLVPHTPLVVCGDMHDIPFAENEFDIVFCNSIDHSLYPEKFLSEIQRVVKPGGLVLLHLLIGVNLRKPNSRQGYDICELDSSKEVIKKFSNSKVLLDQKFYCLNLNWELLLRIADCKNSVE